MENRWLNALLKTIVVAVVLHVIFLVAGIYSGSYLGWFGWTMVWPHWHDGLSILLSLAAGVVLYFAIYLFWTGKPDRSYENQN